MPTILSLFHCFITIVSYSSLIRLYKGYSSCGMEYQDGHHSGNFWWASCDHIAALPVLEDRFNAW